jgi:cell division protein FtsQ
MRPERPRGGIAALLLIGFVVGAWAVAVSPLFHVREIRVRGNRHLSSSEVVRLAGLGPATNILTLSPNRLERALTRSPWVRSVEVRRSLPSTVVLRIQERSPMAWVEQRHGVAVVAADGTILTLRKRSPAGLVSLGRWEEPLLPGARLAALRAALRAVASLPPAIRHRVASASVRRDGVVLLLQEGTRVRYGDGGSLHQKNAALAKVLRWAGERGAGLDYVDLRVPRNPAVRVAGT